MLDTLSKTTGNDAQRAFLTEAFANAQTLTNLAQGMANQHQNLNADQVFDWLYGTENADLMRGRLRQTLGGIWQSTIPVEGELRGGGALTADVRVFCTHDRLREGRARANGEKRLFDPAWTILPDDEDQDQPDTIQICPWFLDYAMQQKAQFRGQFKPGKIATMITKLKLDRLATWVAYTPVDLFQLFDKVIVHELSHTRAGGQLDDVGGFSGYGWKNCRRLSTNRGDDGPHRNADTVALFTSICGLIGENGMVHEDGTFVRGPGADGGEGDDDEGGETKRRALILDENGEPIVEPPALEKRVWQFNAASLKGRPLF
ncbi:uncharacterized protein DNG_06339 [Cephalotrichum gorgonifer]|uniref:Uncharacterized protein n=1 Tax=Cephalotrichum gorgonifer TaxID=2041049 RepID=A0AAE8MZK8_9PEZI|nr:uncharacterized protein DNG_06339 [Cephalotrichum gorgonifer]